MRENQRRITPMKKEINFTESSKFIPVLREKHESIRPLKKYPTSPNCKIWTCHPTDDDGWRCDALVSYEVCPADIIYVDGVPKKLTVTILPEHLTQTTRRHIYAFIRENVPEKHAEIIVNTLRNEFTLPPFSKNRQGKPQYEMVFDILPE